MNLLYLILVLNVFNTNLFYKSRRDTVIRCKIYGYSYDVNWDGHESFIHLYYSDTDSYSYPMMVGTDEDYQNEWSRGHVQFDLSGIPDSAIILSAGLRFYLAYIGQWEDKWDSHSTYVELRDMTHNLEDWIPYSGNDDYTLFYDAADGNYYTDNPLFMSMDPQFNIWYPSDSQFIELNSTAVQDIQNALYRDWFTIGINYTVENDEGVNFFGEETYLYISYLPPDTPYLSQPYLDPAQDTVGAYFTFAINYLDDWGYEPDTILCIIDDTIQLPLYLLQGSNSDGQYGAKIQLFQTGMHRHYFYVKNTNGKRAYYPPGAPGDQISGPEVTLVPGISENSGNTHHLLQNTWKVYDVTGRLIEHVHNFNELSHLGRGVYILQKGNLRKKYIKFK